MLLLPQLPELFQTPQKWLFFSLALPPSRTNSPSQVLGGSTSHYTIVIPLDCGPNLRQQQFLPLLISRLLTSTYLDCSLTTYPFSKITVDSTLGTMTFKATSSWLGLQHQAYVVPSCGVEQKIICYPHNSHATIILMGMSCQANEAPSLPEELLTDNGG